MSLKTVAPKRKWEGVKGLTLRAFGDRVIVKPDEEGIDEHAFGEGVTIMKEGDDVRTSGGIYIPESKKAHAVRRALTGKVVHTGEAVTWVKPGDSILYGEYAGAQSADLSFVGGYEGCIVMAEFDILAKILRKKETADAAA